MARHAYLNAVIESRPIFYSNFEGNDYKISAKIDEHVRLIDPIPELYGEFLTRACADMVELSGALNIEEVLTNMKNGKWTFLFRPDGSFESNAF